MDVHLGGAAAMPGSEQDTALSALMLNVLERVHDVRNAAETEQAAETESPSTIHLLASVSKPPNSTPIDSLCSVANLIGNVGHCTLSASRAVSRSRRSVERGNGRGILVDGSTLLLGRHARVLLVLLILGLAGRLRRHVLLLLLWRRRATVLLLGRLLIHGGLLVLLLIRVLVDGRLATSMLVGEVGGLGILVHGNCAYLLVAVQLLLVAQFERNTGSISRARLTVCRNVARVKAHGLDA